jgi:6-phosphogluconolactonase
MKILYKIFFTPEELADSFAEELTGIIKAAEIKRRLLTIAISGGSTPGLFFSVLSEKYSTAVDWSFVKLFWVDERCVPPDDAESNFGMTKRILLSKIEIPSENVFRIRGEDDPVKEAARYSGVIDNQIRQINSNPVFDIVLLGMGEDGHTASIFPGNEKLFSSKINCDVAVHPVSGQKRITITGKVINNARSVFFLVTGKNKAEIVNEIFRNSAVSGMFPAAHIRSLNGITTWLLDNEAGKFIV